jgi:hypothetical protein
MCHLQELYAKYSDKGLVVLGFDASDDKQIALEMLRDNKVTFPNIIDSSDAALKVCFQQYQRFGRSAVPMSYVIGRDGKIVDAWYGYEEGEARTIAAMQKVGGELAESIRRDVQAKVAESSKAVAAAARRLFQAIRAADYNHDWTGGNDWEHFPSDDVEYCVAHGYPSWVRWVCAKFKKNPITDVRLGEVFAGPDGSPTVHFELQLKDGEVLKGDLPFRWKAETKRWMGWEALDWHLQKKP